MNKSQHSKTNFISDCYFQFMFSSTLFIALTTGSIKSWKYPFNEAELSEELEVNNNIEKMKRSITNPNLIATGGKDNDLKLWDLNTKSVTFQAKNVTIVINGKSYLFPISIPKI